MKNYCILFLIFIAATSLQSCDKESYGDHYDVVDSLPPYVEISSKAAVTVVQGKSANIAVRLRTAVQEPVVVKYAVSGAINTTGTATIARNTLSVSIPVVAPDGSVPAGSTTATASFNLVSATKGTKELTIGIFGPEKEVKTIRITR